MKSLCPLAIAFTFAAHAQDLRNAQPKPPEPMPEPAKPAAPPSAEDASKALSGFSGLKVSGIVVITSPADVAAGGREPKDLPPGGVDVSRAPVTAREELRAALATLVGKPVTPELLRAIPAVATRPFAAAGKPFVNVVIPEQDMTGGVLQVIVVEGRLGKVTVTGERWFSKSNYTSPVRAKPGEPIDAKSLDEDMAWIAENPFRRADVSAQPGATPGTTDLTIRAQDRFPARVYAGYEDTGNRSTGIERINAGVNWGNVLGLGHLVNYQASVSPDLEKSVSHSVSYVAPLMWHDTLSASWTYGKIRPEMPAPFDQTGRSTNVGVRYRWNLPDLADVKHALTFGGDYRRSDNNLLFSNAPVSGNTTHIWELSLGWDGTLADGHGETTLGLTGFFSPGNLDSKNDDDSFDISRAGAKARYAYLGASLTRRTSLPGALSLLTQLSAQEASTNLIGSEQFALGGAYTVRGYDDGDTYGDRGVILRNELSLPSFRLLSHVLSGMPEDRFTPFVFTDWGVTGPRDPLPGERTSVALGSAGVGFQYAIGRYGSLNLAYGWQLRDSLRPEPTGGGRFHVSATLSY